MLAVMECLADVRPYRVVLGGRYGFDFHIAWAGALLGLEVYTHAPWDDAACLKPGYRRPLEMVDDACLLVAFPPVVGVTKKRAAMPEDESTPPPVLYWTPSPIAEADPAVVCYARSIGIPVLGVGRDAVCVLEKE